MTDRLETITTYVKTHFNPVKHFQKKPMELFYVFFTVIASIIILTITCLFCYFSITKILIPCLRLNTIYNFFRPNTSLSEQEVHQPSVRFEHDQVQLKVPDRSETRNPPSYSDLTVDSSGTSTSVRSPRPVPRPQRQTI